METEQRDLHRSRLVLHFPAPEVENLIGRDGESDVAEEIGRFVDGKRDRLELQVKWWSLVKVDIGELRDKEEG